jgi:ubiquitin-conjugating enzyme E2 Q
MTGHVTIGGSICMELLTRSAWSAANDVERFGVESVNGKRALRPNLEFQFYSILVQIQAEIASDPNAALDLSAPNRVYDEHEARAAFERMCAKYGWNK